MFRRGDAQTAAFIDARRRFRTRTFDAQRAWYDAETSVDDDAARYGARGGVARVCERIARIDVTVSDNAIIFNVRARTRRRGVANADDGVACACIVVVVVYARYGGDGGDRDGWVCVFRRRARRGKSRGG